MEWHSQDGFTFVLSSYPEVTQIPPHAHESAFFDIRQLRCEWACEQLRSSSMPLAEIALAAGFADQSHFCKTFKRLMGLTPGEFRAQLSTAQPRYQEKRS